MKTDASLARSAEPRFVPWLHRVQGALLFIGSLYLLAIDKLSPHHLPGLRWIAFSVLSAGLMSGIRSTRFRRVERAMGAVVVVFGLMSVAELMLQSVPHVTRPAVKSAALTMP
jgi:hypothetical protein